MKILFLNDDFPPFGWSSPGILTYNLARKLKELGHEIYILTTSQDKNFQEKEIIDGLNYYRVYSNYNIRWRDYLNLYNFQIAKKLNEIFEEIKPEVTHLHIIHLYLSYYSIFLAKKYSQKVFLTAHDYQLFSYNKLEIKHLNNKYTFFDGLKQAKKRFNPFRNIIIRHYIKKLKRIFVLSQAQKKIFELNNINNLEVLPNAIDLADWQIARSDIENFKQKYNLTDKKIIFFGGRLSLEKGLGQIIKSFEAIRAKLGFKTQFSSDCVLFIAGEINNLIDECLDKINQSASKNVIIAGWLDRQMLKTAIASSDLVVTPSIYPDPFNMLNLEAMACKKPVIGTCFGGTPEIVKDGETGFIVNPFEVELMAERVIELLQDENKAKEFGENGYQRAKERFSLDHHVEKLLNYYKVI